MSNATGTHYGASLRPFDCSQAPAALFLREEAARPKDCFRKKKKKETNKNKTTRPGRRHESPTLFFFCNCGGQKQRQCVSFMRRLPTALLIPAAVCLTNQIIWLFNSRARLKPPSKGTTRVVTSPQLFPVRNRTFTLASANSVSYKKQRTSARLIQTLSTRTVSSTVFALCHNEEHQERRRGRPRSRTLISLVHHRRGPFESFPESERG